MSEHQYAVATVRPATAQDAHRLAPKLRKADLQEINAASGSTPLAALLRGVVESSKVFAITSPSDPHDVFALFGVAPLTVVGAPTFPIGSVWLLGSEDLNKVAYRFLRESSTWLDELARGYRLLCNVVDARNTTHIRWLRWLGFRFVAHRPGFGRQGEAFIEFCKINHTP
jgi:hypothetical protein